MGPPAEADINRNAETQAPADDSRPEPAMVLEYGAPTVWCKVADIQLDDSFRNLLPPALPDEIRRMETDVLTSEYQEPLIVWPCQRRRMLLVGYDRFLLWQRQGRRTVRVVEHRCASRAEARWFVVCYHLGRQHLNDLEISYLRGLFYAENKSAHGGDRRSVQFQASVNQLYKKDGDALAERLNVDLRTLQRDAELTVAVDGIVDVCGQNAKGLLLRPERPLRRKDILTLRRMENHLMKQAMFELEINHQLPAWLRANGPPRTITLPREPAAFVKKLVERVGAKEAVAYAKGLLDLIALRRDGASPEKRAESCAGEEGRQRLMIPSPELEEVASERPGLTLYGPIGTGPYEAEGRK
jgi:hypothetical protein